jgi:SH3-like domain-containing protein
MAKRSIVRQRFMSAMLVGLCLLVAAGVAYSIFGRKASNSNIAQAANAATASTTAAPQLGPSGLPLPRFVSLKTEKVNVRKGPSSDHAVAWVFQSKGLPVEITAEFETWRRIRDSEGAEGWILQNMLAGKRTALISPSRKFDLISMMYGASDASGTVAKLHSGVMADIASCDGKWCRILVSGYDGYIDQNLIWGAYPGEVVN